jgi:hypothetical protein
MKYSVVLLIMASIQGLSTQPEAFADGDAKTFAETLPNAEKTANRLFPLLSRTTEGIQHAWSLYEQGGFQAALDAWRDHKVRRFRRMYLGRFNTGHMWFTDDKPWADWLVGEDIEVHSDEIDRWGDRGKPKTRPPINWISDKVEKRVCNPESGYGWYLRYIPLAGTFYTTGESVYLAKWFEITADFSLNQKRMILNAGFEPETLL